MADRCTVTKLSSKFPDTVLGVAPMKLCSSRCLVVANVFYNWGAGLEFKFWNHMKITLTITQTNCHTVTVLLVLCRMQHCHKECSANSAAIINFSSRSSSY